MRIIFQKDKYFDARELDSIISYINSIDQVDTFHIESNSNGISFCVNEKLKLKQLIINPIKKDESFISDAIKEIVEYLNMLTGKRYSYKAKANCELIRARLINDNYSIDDFKLLIDNKVSSWMDDITMNQYLRPETLFCKKHFESYLNEKPVKDQEDDLFQELESFTVKGK